MKNLLLLLILCVFGGTCLGQNLTGIWKGYLRMSGCFKENFIELALQMDGSDVIGDSYHFENIDKYVKKTCTGIYNADTRKLQIQEGIITTYLIPNDCIICTKNFNLSYKKEENVETLYGIWGGHISDTKEKCSTGDIVLTRVTASSFKDVPEVKVDTGTIRLDFYDNAEIDGDIISVKINGKVIIANQTLGITPITTFVSIDLKNTFYEVEMIAENQGTIPPNTALLIINAEQDRHLLYLSSTEEKNARVRLVYDPLKGLKKLRNK